MRLADSERTAGALVSFTGLCAIVLWAPIPLGSNRPWSWSLLGMGVGILVGAWALERALTGARSPPAVDANLRALLALAAWVAYTAVQALPLTGAVSAVIPAATTELARVASDAGARGVASISVDRSATLHALVRHATYAGLTLLVLATVDSRRRIRLLLLLIAMLGTIEAVYGIVAHFTTGYMSLWRPGTASGGGVTGTYVNRNHLAGLLELCIPAAAALLWLESAASTPIRGLRDVLSRITRVMLGPGLLYAFCILVMIGGLLLTGSRGALGGAGAGMILAVLLAGWRRAGPGVLASRIALLALVPLVAAVWLGAGSLIEKIGASGLESNRGELRASGYAMLADRPLLGSGAGTFRWVFPAYKTQRIGPGFYEHAHNDLLELALDQGAVGVVLAGLGVALLMGAAARAALARAERTARAGAFAAIAGTGALLVHGLVDFNLQIPANAAIFFVLLGLGATCSVVPARAHRARRAAVRG